MSFSKENVHNNNLVYSKRKEEEKKKKRIRSENSFYLDLCCSKIRKGTSVLYLFGI